MATATSKDLGLQSLRGIAVLLMVAGHVIGSNSSQGLQVQDHSGWRFFYRALEDLRMPLFTAISGYVYARRPALGAGSFRPLLIGKSRRLAVPFLTVCTVFFLTQALVPGTNTRPKLHELPMAYLWGYDHLWFLQAVLWIFLTVGLLDRYRILDDFPWWCLVLTGSILLHILLVVPQDVSVLSINGALRLLPFFLVGYGLNRHACNFPGLTPLIVAASLFAPLYSLKILEILSDFNLPPWLERGQSTAIGALGVFILMQCRQYTSSRSLAWLGGYSFGIYLLHVFGSAGSRILANHFGLTDTGMLFVVSLVFGLSFPILFEICLGTIPVVSWGILGQRPRTQHKRRTANAPLSTAEAINNS